MRHWDTNANDSGCLNHRTPSSVLVFEKPTRYSVDIEPVCQQTRGYRFAENNTSVDASKKKWRPPINCFPCYSCGSNLRSDGGVEAPFECKDPTGCRGSFGFLPGRVVREN